MLFIFHHRPDETSPLILQVPENNDERDTENKPYVKISLPEAVVEKVNLVPSATTNVGTVTVQVKYADETSWTTLVYKTTPNSEGDIPLQPAGPVTELRVVFEEPASETDDTYKVKIGVHACYEAQISTTTSKSTTGVTTTPSTPEGK